MNYQNQRKAVLFSAVLMLAVLAASMALPLSVSAASNRMDAAAHPPLHRTAAFSIDNGKVTDGDGIIGNSLYGADARHPHTKASAKSGSKHMSGSVAGAVRGAANGVKRAADDIVDGAEQVVDGIGNAARNATNGIMGRDTTGGNDAPLNGDNDMLPGENDATADDHTPADPEAEEHLPENTPATDPQNSVDPTDPVPPTAPDNDAMRPEGESKRGIIGWVIAILVIIAGALIVLALLPKKQHDRR